MNDLIKSFLHGLEKLDAEETKADCLYFSLSREEILAIYNALNKANPMRIVKYRTEGYGAEYICPSCRCGLKREVPLTGYVYYCPGCGQRIDWSGKWLRK